MRIELIVSLLCLVASGTAQSAWPDLVPPIQGTGGRHDAAVVVGIEDYQWLTDVPGAAKNVEAWEAWFLQGRGIHEEHVALLTDEQATQERIIETIEDASRFVGTSGTLWFVFVGHGGRHAAEEDGLLVGVDARRDRLSLESRSVRHRWLLEKLEETKAQQVIAVFDVCFAGVDWDRRSHIPGEQGAERFDYAPVLKTIALYAAESHEVAGSLPGGKRPAFSYLLLGAMRGWGDADHDRKVTAKEAIDYTAGTLRMLDPGRKQNPNLQGDTVLATGVEEPGPDRVELRRKMRTSSSTRTYFGVSLLSLGAMAAAGGLYARSKNHARYDALVQDPNNDALRNDVDRYGALAINGYVVGALLTVVGLSVLFGSDNEEDARLVAVPSGIGVVGHW